jgi:hypothetical protein
MASINDFKLVNIKSKKYFNLLKSEINFDSDKMTEKEKERYGFYPYMLESICGIKDISDLTNLITDTDFNASILNKSKTETSIDYIDYPQHKSKKYQSNDNVIFKKLRKG